MTTPVVAADEREVHPVLWGAEGVADAARELAAARRAPVELAEERRHAHAAWQAENQRNALKKNWEPAPEPRPDVDHDERVKLDARRRAAEVKLEAVVGANADVIVEGLREWEADAMRRARDLVAGLDAIRREAALAGKALRAVSASQQARPERQPNPKVEDLVYLAGKGEDVALLNFGDGRTLWLEVTGRS